MTIEKLKSGSYRITQMENGQRYRITIDHKPTKTEAMRLLSERFTKSVSTPSNMTLTRACTAYVDDRENIISPSTIVGYRSLIRRIPEKYGNMHLMTITNATIQALTNEYATTHNSKTTNNMISFALSVLSYYDITIKYPTLPQKEKKSPYIPTKDDVMAVFSVIKGTKYEIPITLAALGLRRSEICSLTIDDLDGNRLTINKAKVQDENKEWVIKSTKTLSSNRVITIPDELADAIRSQGYVFNGDPGTIYKNLRRAQNKAGVPYFHLHKLRHFFASYMHNQGYTDKQIQEAGGWRDGSRIMKMVYQHAMDMEQAQKGMADSIQALMS